MNLTLDRRLAHVIRPIVMGQVKTWQKAHPNGERFPGHMVRGVAKRVTNELCSPQVVERIKLALEPGSEAASEAIPGNERSEDLGFQDR